jgi:hypothetical protein
LDIASNLHKGFKCIDPSEGRVYISHDVVFDGHVFPFSLHPNAGARLTNSMPTNCVSNSGSSLLDVGTQEQFFDENLMQNVHHFMCPPAGIALDTGHEADSPSGHHCTVQVSSSRLALDPLSSMHVSLGSSMAAHLCLCLLCPPMCRKWIRPKGAGRWQCCLPAGGSVA